LGWWSAGLLVALVVVPVVGLDLRVTSAGAGQRLRLVHPGGGESARAQDIRLIGVLPSDESLENVFSYLVGQ
jgi:hypothetical protein